ncbi:excisionase family DNA-binding protein [Paenibacillus sp. ACRSA]|uniref:excisionase family DNA-binding protein n=1 Tax=Paenibacillus sp. ACRSA TaxID=2918211 RepID=UPI001EF4B35F|nr:excisionase family DNA-binding protein [Paenibacillus sp. ACRSA]MCG7377368.1 excisionase family DNA-binding protein [Paenibacillus sp. ACRSA]
MIGHIIRGEDEAKYWYDKHFTVKEAASYLDISTYKIRKLIKQHEIPYSRSCNQVSFHKCLLDSWKKGEVIGGQVKLILDDECIDFDHEEALREHFKRYPELVPKMKSVNFVPIVRYIDGQKVTINAETVMIESDSGQLVFSLSREFLRQLMLHL